MLCLSTKGARFRRAERFGVEFIAPAIAVLGTLAGNAGFGAWGYCPHRGRVWGSVLAPLAFVALYPEWTLVWVAVAAAAVVGAGVTAHRSLGLSCLAVLVAGLAAAGLARAW